MPVNSKPERLDGWPHGVVNIDKCKPEEFRKLWYEYKNGEPDSSIYISILVIFGNLAIFEPIDDDSIFKNRKMLATILVFDENLSKNGILARKKLFELGVFNYYDKRNSWKNQKNSCISHWRNKCTRIAVENSIIFEKKDMIDKIEYGISKNIIPSCRYK